MTRKHMSNREKKQKTRCHDSDKDMYIWTNSITQMTAFLFSISYTRKGEFMIPIL